MHQSSPDPTKARELVTLIVRLMAFAVTLIPLVAMMQPWVTLDGIEESLSGVDAIALLVPPMSEYLYTVSPLQAAIVTLGPVLVALLAVIISDNYRRRKSVFWAPPAMLAVIAGITYGAADFVTDTEQGLTIVMAVAVLLTLHQVAIRRLYIGRWRSSPGQDTIAGENDWTGQGLAGSRLQNRWQR